jgi:glycine hydroxymethyltransferase
VPPADPSGIRPGTPALTTRGLRVEHMPRVSAWIDRALEATARHDRPARWRIAGEVRELPAGYPIPGWRQVPAACRMR